MPLEDLDHYKFRRTRRLAIQARVELTDQFDHQEWWPADLHWYEALGSPAMKWHAEVQTAELRHPDIHLTAFSIKTPPQTPRNVEVSNQFTAFVPQRWKIADPELLLVPAAKRHDGSDFEAQMPEPPPGQHYACYKVIEAPELSEPVHLQDQFDREPRPAMVRRPLYLGVPVRKRHNDFPVAGHWMEEIHLVLYDINSGVTVRDQFGQRSLELGAVMLGVPSFKRWLQ